jgi:hypothetical protein
MKCPSCGYENKENSRYCNLCQHAFVKEPQAPYGLSSLAKPAGEAVQKVPGSRVVGENWFQRHLNWTWLLAQCAVQLLGAIVAYFIFDSLPRLSLSSLVMSAMVISIAFLALYSLSWFGVGVWVLKRKNRSLWWISMLLAPFAFYWAPSWVLSLVGLIVVICFLRLENRSELVVMPVSAGPSGSSGLSSGSSSSIPPGLAPYGLGPRADKYGP